MKRWLNITLILLITLLLSACGGGGGSSSPDTDSEQNSSQGSGEVSDNYVNVGTFGNQNIKNIKRNPMMVKIKSLYIKEIDISLIGDAKAKYALDNSQDKERTYEALDHVGGADANLSNRENPITLENGQFYHIETTFNIDGIYPDGVNFEVVLVEDNGDEDNNVTSITLFNKTIELEGEGEQHFGVDVLVPLFINIKRHLLVVHLVDEGLEKMTKSDDKITNIPQIGATYIDIDYDMQRESIKLLDLNSSNYTDIPTNMKFQNGHAQEKSGDASLLFSNIGKYQGEVTISATLEYKDGESFELYLLNSGSGEIEKEVIYTIPSKYGKGDKVQKRNKVDDQLSPLDGIREIHPTVNVHFTQGVEENFGDKRYSLDLAYYLPEDKFQEILAKTPDLSNDADTEGREGKIQWHVKVNHVDLIPIQRPNIATQFTPQTSLSEINLHLNPAEGISVAPITDQIVTIDAALYMDDEHAYVFDRDKYARYNVKEKKVINDWKPISEKWKGVMDEFDHIDAVFYDNKTLGLDRIYFFSDKKYLVYDNYEDRISVDLWGHKNIGEIEKFWYKEKIPFSTVHSAFYDKGEDALYILSGVLYFKFENWSKPNQRKIQSRGYIKTKWGMIPEGMMGMPKRIVTLFDLFGQPTRRINRPDVFQSKNSNNEQGKGDSSIAALQLHAKADILSRWYVPGMIGDASSDLNFYLFGHQFSLIAAKAQIAASTKKYHPELKEIYKDAEGELKKIKYQYGATLSLDVLGTRIEKWGEMKEGRVSEVLEKNSPIGKSYKEKLPRYDRDWNEKITLFHVEFPVGPIVVEVEGGVDGGVGLHVGMEYLDQGVGAKIDSKIYLSNSFTGENLNFEDNKDGFSIFFRGGIDEAIVHAGIRGDIRLVMAALIADLSSGMVQDGNNLDFTLNADVDFELKLIQAAVSLYAGTRTHIEWCSSWGIPYPCGLGWDDFTYELYHTPWLYSREWELLDEHLPITSIPLHL